MNRLAYLRNQAGLTQKQLSDATGLAVSYISKMEYGERSVSGISLKNAVKIADALGVKDLREFLKED